MIFYINPLFPLCTYTHASASAAAVQWCCVSEMEKNISIYRRRLSIGAVDEKQIFHFSALTLTLSLPRALVSVVLLFVLWLPKMADCQG